MMSPFRAVVTLIGPCKSGGIIGQRGAEGSVVGTITAVVVSMGPVTELSTEGFTVVLVEVDLLRVVEREAFENEEDTLLAAEADEVGEILGLWKK